VNLFPFLNGEKMSSLSRRIHNFSLFVWLISHQPAVLFFSEQISHQQPASSTFSSEQTSTSHQPPAKRTCRLFVLQV
jgi:hypothetical protein